MVTTLNRVQVGNVGDIPGRILMKTESSIDSVKEAGFMNKVLPYSGIKLNPTDFVFAACSGNLLGIFIPIFDSEGIITLKEIAGSQGGGGFDLINTYFVAKGGSDLNPGKSSSDPKLTISGAMAAVVAGSPGSKNLIYIMDSGIYTEGVFSPLSVSDLTIYGPDATMKSTGSAAAFSNQVSDQVITIDVQTIDSNGYRGIQANCTINAHVQKFIGSGLAYVGSGQDSENSSINFDTCVSDMECASIRINGGFMSGDIETDGSDQILMNIHSMTGDISGTAPVNATMNFFDGTYSSSGVLTATINELGESAVIPDTAIGKIGPNLYGNIFAFGQINGQPYNVIVWNSARTITLNSSNFETYSNAFIYYTGSDGFGRFNLVDDSAIPVGFKVSMFQLNNDNQAGAQATTDAVLESASTVTDVAYTRRNGSWITLIKTGNDSPNTWIAYGDLWQSNLATLGINTYVSSLFGSDVTGLINSIEQPFATIQAAVTALGSPVNRSNIVIMDDETYNENVTISSGNINIIGRNAVLTSNTGDTLTISTASSPITQDIQIGSLIAVSGSPIVSTTVANVRINLISDRISGSSAILVGDGELLITAGEISADKTITGTGNMFYVATKNSGTNSEGETGSIEGISPSGTSVSNFDFLHDANVLGTLTVSNQYSLPTTAGSLNQTITNNGDGTSSWGTPTEVLISSFNVGSATNSLPFTSLGSYRTYVIEVSNVVCSTACDVILQFDDGAGGWDTSAQYYATSYFGDSSSTGGSWGSGPGSGINVFMNINTIVGFSSYASFKLMGMNQIGVSPALTGTGFVTNNATGPVIWSNVIAGGLLDASNKTGFRLFATAGNITSGRVVIYGRDPI